MALVFSCPNCRARLCADDHLAGQTQTCPACAGSIPLPREPGTPLQIIDEPPSSTGVRSDIPSPSRPSAATGVDQGEALASAFAAGDPIGLPNQSGYQVRLSRGHFQIPPGQVRSWERVMLGLRLSQLAAQANLYFFYFTWGMLLFLFFLVRPVETVLSDWLNLSQFVFVHHALRFLSLAFFVATIGYLFLLLALTFAGQYLVWAAPGSAGWVALFSLACLALCLPLEILNLLNPDPLWAILGHLSSFLTLWSFSLFLLLATHSFPYRELRSDPLFFFFVSPLWWWVPGLLFWAENLTAPLVGEEPTFGEFLVFAFLSVFFWAGLSWYLRCVSDARQAVLRGLCGGKPS